MAQAISVSEAEAEAEQSRQAAVLHFQTLCNLPALAVGRLDVSSPLDCRVYVSGVRKMGEAGRTPVLPTDRFILGSCTKAMTATVLAVLVERKLLSWDLTLPQALPALADRMHPAYAAVTVERMASHTGSLVSDLDHRHYRSLSKLTLIEARRAAAALVLSSPPAYTSEGGARFLYSNMGYIILGLMMEEATGQAWEALLTVELFQPLGMSSFGFGCQADLRVDPPNQPWPHVWRFNPEDGHLSAVPVDAATSTGANALWRGPAGGVHCSLADWARFAQLHIDGACGRPTPILSPASFARLHSAPAQQSYTYGGWGRRDNRVDGLTLSHSGSNKKGSARIVIAPHKGLAYVAAANATASEEEGQPGKSPLEEVIKHFIEADRTKSGTNSSSSSSTSSSTGSSSGHRDAWG